MVRMPWVSEADSHSLRDQQPAVSLDCWLLFFATTVASRGAGPTHANPRAASPTDPSPSTYADFPCPPELAALLARVRSIAPRSLEARSTRFAFLSEGRVPTGRPSFLPLTLVAARPDLTRSRMRSRSKVAIPA